MNDTALLAMLEVLIAAERDEQGEFTDPDMAKRAVVQAVKMSKGGKGSKGKSKPAHASHGEHQAFADRRDRKAARQGFTGSRTDKRGHKRCYQGGKPVSCHPGGVLQSRHAGTGKPKKSKRAGSPASSSADEEHSKAIGQVLAEAGDAAHAGQSLEERLGEHGDSIPESKWPKLKKTWKVVKAVEHKLMIGFHKAKEMAVEVAKERGLSQEQADRAGKIVGVVDQILTWTTTFPVVSAVTGNLALGKVASFIPIASLAYIAGSAVRNPFAAIRAARNVIKRTLSKEEGVAQHAESRVGRREATMVADAVRRSWGNERWFALLHAALDETQGDLKRSIALANQAQSAGGKRQ